MYPIKSLFNVNETFTELLANVLILVYVLIWLWKKMILMYTFYTKKLFNDGRYFSLVQLNKILIHEFILRTIV